MPKIEQAAEDYTLPDGALCLTKHGWTSTLEEVQIQMDPGMNLQLLELGFVEVTLQERQGTRVAQARGRLLLVPATCLFSARGPLCLSDTPGVPKHRVLGLLLDLVRER